MQGSLLQPEDAVTRGGEPGIVRGDDRGQSVLGVHLAEQRMQSVRCVFVQIPRRFVREQQ